MDINKQSFESIFLQSVTEGNLDKIRSCINLGINVNICDNNGTPVLMSAIMNPNPDMLKLFLSQPNIDVNIKNQNAGGTTVLMFACMAGLPDVVKILCQVPGIDLNFQTGDGITAAIFAVSYQNQGCVQVLSTVPGVNWNIKDKENVSPLALAVHRGCIDILRILMTIPTIDFNIGGGSHKTIAQIAVESSGPNSIHCLNLLSRDSRVNWNIRSADGETPIMYAWKNRRSEMFRILMNIPTIDRNTFMQETFNVIDGMSAPECPVCYDRFTRNSHVFQCTLGHFVCERCHQRIQSCPKCRGQMAGRCHDFEQFLQTLNL